MTVSTLGIRTKAQDELVDITADVRRLVRESGVERGVCLVYVPHTTAGVTVNESADPDVARDILEALTRMVPRHGAYRHAEGNAAAHIRATLVGSSATIPVEGGDLALGTWQGVFFCEFDGPRSRRVNVRVLRCE
ncbi:MAG: secondary thiamine-phosphate synthase enzyme YjbQ [Firmicutes bacterium]|jgi:secondary thiamine-phosphate synthase enzyme|nr:secondary thiamine-phosphate synthase enzyme YjbQ [Bacillota bacterium]MDH7495906.1 secondary thiamine-phosphate synthase enzyme YjbQ [Bacillota bacterium]